MTLRQVMKKSFLHNGSNAKLKVESLSGATNWYTKKKKKKKKKAEYHQNYKKIIKLNTSYQFIIM
jgi:hypothetical protein